jgi:hypothetical protein
MIGTGRPLSTLRYLVALVALAPAVSYAQTTTPTTTATAAKDVNVVNTPSVQIANIPIVDVANTPNVHVTNVPGVSVVNIPTVTVTNEPNDPVLVRSVDDPARHAFQMQVAIPFVDGTMDAKKVFSLPEGKRLVIEFVSAEGTWIIGQHPYLYVLRTRVNGTVVPHTITPPPNLTDFNTFEKPVRIYADGGTDTASVFVVRDSDHGTGEARITISGYLVDMP